MPETTYDLCIVGGGVNGCGIARDAAGRGASVVLFEKDDLANATSSASTKLIHGGLRYLEHFEFRLVRESLQEREVIWSIAPHIVWPLRFVLPIRSAVRGGWLIRTGLWLYDHIGGRKLLPPTRTIALRSDPAGAPLKPELTRGYEYSDCWVDDARLVVLNARDAADRGAVIRTRTRVVGADRQPDGWNVVVETPNGARERVFARILVNAAGPWTSEVLGATLGVASSAGSRLVQGSHIVTRRLFDHDRSYIFQNADRRIVFAIPFERDFTLIGTTDRDYDGTPTRVGASDDEITYLCASASEYFARPVRREDVVWSYSGLRALYDDGASAAQQATRDYVLALDTRDGAPLLSVFGGKITTYRRLAEAVLAKLKPHLPAAGRPAWTATAALPGGDFPMQGFEAVLAETQRRRPWLPDAMARRLLRAYGTRIEALLGDAGSMADLGYVFGADLTEREVEYLVAQEWASSADDILWRRSKLGLRLTKPEVSGLGAYLAASSVRGAEAEADRKRA